MQDMPQAIPVDYPSAAPPKRKIARARNVSALLDNVHNQDCLTLMKGMPDNSVNMIFADPPFNLNKKYTSYKDNLPFAEYMAWTEQWLAESCRVLKNDGSIFVYNIPKLLVYTAPLLNQFAEFKHWIAWNSNGRPLGKTMQPAHYGILFYTKSRDAKFYDVRTPHQTCRVCKEYVKDYGGKKHLRHEFGRQISDVWDDIHRVRHSSKRIGSHPCQLPPHLIERMILMTTDEGDVIFDPFCGGGSAAVATKQMGRRYIGAEIDKGYCAAVRKKIKATEETKIGDVFASSHCNKIISIRDVDWQKL